MILEQFIDVSSINNMFFNLLIHRIDFFLQYFNWHLSGHNNLFLVHCDAYVYAVTLLVRTIKQSKIIGRFLYVIIDIADMLSGHNNDFLSIFDSYVYAVPLWVRTMKVLEMIGLL